MTTQKLLEVHNIAKRFGGVHAVRDVSLDLTRGTVLGVIGPNGSGKTTVINLLSGVYRTDRGSIRLNGTDCSRRQAHVIAKLGLGRTFQNPHVFKSLTVRQNMFVGSSHRQSDGTPQNLATQADEWIALVGLAAMSHRVANELSGGQQKLVEFARVMVRQPPVVLMDEPFAGVHPQVKKVLHDQIRQASGDRGTAFLIVSHEVPDLIDLSDHFVCMAGGSVLRSGEPAEVCQDPQVIESYLGAPTEPDA